MTHAQPMFSAHHDGAASLQAVNKATTVQKDYFLIIGITELPRNALIG